MICCTKIIIIFLYLSIYVAALERTSKSMIYWACNIQFFIFPLIMLAYWVALLKNKLS